MSKTGRFNVDEILSMAASIIEALNDLGYIEEDDLTETIQALVQAIVMLADGNDQMLDMASNLLVDGGV